MTASNVHGIGGINTNNIGSYKNKIEWNTSEWILLTQITKQTLLIGWFFIASITYWPAFMVYTFSLIDDSEYYGKIAYILMIFLANFFYVTVAISLWLSFSFAKPKYQILCNCCHTKCQLCCAFIAAFALQQNQKKSGGFGEPLLEEEKDHP